MHSDGRAGRKSSVYVCVCVIRKNCHSLVIHSKNDREAAIYFLHTAARGYLSRGMTGIPTRALLQLALDLSKKKEEKEGKERKKEGKSTEEEGKVEE